MITTGALTLAPQGDREILMSRGFDAPRRLVFDAYTKPALVQRWLGVFGDWTMPVCEMDVRVGGRYRWVWKNGRNGHEMGMGGVFREIVAPERLVATERFDDAWYPGEALITTSFAEEAGRTLLTVVMRYESQEARDGVLASPMETGLVKTYDNLEALLPALAQGRWIETPSVLDVPARPAAVIRLTIPRAEMPAVMGPAIGEVIDAVTAQGIGPAGPVFAHHLAMSEDVFDFEVGVPVTGPLAAVGRVLASELPAARVARTVYHGPYEGLHGAWTEFDTWMAAHGHTPGRSLWEVYAAGPESSQDPATWRTELNRPLAR